MSEDSQSLERAVARFVVNYTHDDIDAATLDAVKGLIKDQFAIQIGASVLPWSQKTLAFRNPRPGAATIVNHGSKGAAVDAAYVNASYGHGFEYDDFFGNAHPGCAVVPAAFAMAEKAAGLSPRAVEIAKTMIHAAADEDRAAAIEALGSAAAGGTEDRAEGVAAFTEKRPAEFSGR